MLVGCGPKVHFTEYIDIGSTVWHKDSLITFEPTLTEASKAVDLTIHVRHTGLYGYSNLFLFRTTTLPNGKTQQDTIECKLADKRGMWEGSGIGDIFDFEQSVGRIIAPEQGTYKFTIQQGMRTDELEEIMDIGFSITEVEN